MIKYKEIANVSSDKMQCSIDTLSCFLEELWKSHPEEVEKVLIEQVGIFNDNHFEEKSAEFIIDKMKPSIGNKTSWEVLKEKGITLETSRERINDAYYRARDYALENGLRAMTIPEEYTDYDYYVVLAMCAMDYWYEGMTRDDSLCMLAYQFMADSDACTTKVWDYFF